MAVSFKVYACDCSFSSRERQGRYSNLTMGAVEPGGAGPLRGEAVVNQA